MKIRDFEWASISRYRSELMGLAIIFVVLFHVHLPRSDMFFGLRRMGNIGVDIFFFLSGMGLWFSWIKPFLSHARPSAPAPSPTHVSSDSIAAYLRSFYLRRFLRIYPTWLLVACAFYIPAFVRGERRSANIVDLIGDITINWDFWIHDELTFWYIPATMAFYLLAPLYMELIRRYPVYRWLPVLMVVWCVVVQWVVPVHQAVGHLEIFWSRVPIFFLGINMGEAIRRKDTIDGHGLWLLLLTFVVTLATCIYLEQVRHGRFPLFVERLVYIPLTVTSLLLMARLLEHASQWLGRSLRFVGTLSLEIYLLHVQFVLLPLTRQHWGYWPTFLACIGITLPIAWLMSKLVTILTKPIQKHTK